MMTRDKVQTSVFAVDMRNELADLTLELGGVGEGGGSYLGRDKGEISNRSSPSTTVLEE